MPVKGLMTGGVQSIVGKSLDFLMSDMTLKRRIPAALTTYQSWKARGLVTNYTGLDRLNTEIQAGDRKILILQLSLTATAPQTNDQLITSEGKTFIIVNVQADPANATWTLQGRS
jgi:hypothetical protein